MQAVKFFMITFFVFYFLKHFFEAKKKVYHIKRWALVNALSHLRSPYLRVFFLYSSDGILHICKHGSRNLSRLVKHKPFVS